MVEQSYPTASLLPLFIDVSGKRILIVGGGSVATRKAINLSGTGCDLEVVAPAVSEEIQQLELLGRLRVTRRTFRPADARGRFIIIAATDNGPLNQLIELEAHSNGALVNRTDSNNSEVMVPSSFKRGTLQVAVSTGGASPSFSRMVRKALESVIDQAFGIYTLFLADLRALALAQISDAKIRRQLFLNIDHPSYLERIRQGQALDAQEELDTLLLNLASKEEE